MGSELSNTSESTKVENIDESNSELKEADKVSNLAGKIDDDSFHQSLVKLPSTSQANNSAAQTFHQAQGINAAVKTSVQLGSSNSEGDSNLSSHISMSVSGQARVNSNVSR